MEKVLAAKFAKILNLENFPLYGSSFVVILCLLNFVAMENILFDVVSVNRGAAVRRETEYSAATTG